MTLFKKKPDVVYNYEAGDQEILERASKRVQGLSTGDLLDWADTAGTGMGQGFWDYRAHGDIQSLEEIKDAVIALQAVVLCLIDRAKLDRGDFDK